ncbi:hypothetical protein IB229_00915 [Pseudomonas sp. PDM14]|uniref:hypothetical protein n=1 Tax=Pseudomonas sp. PDM14 TaxID=2769288 RepID=UPI0017875B36|nr:hypothetical protein [Pseudomonas sp. PDM14]MBD9481518.1 hypothetical protein [Pseudomonas sp. PDM14]
MKVSDENPPTLDQPSTDQPRKPKQTSLPKQEHGGVMYQRPFGKVERIPQVVPGDASNEPVAEIPPPKERRINPDCNGY